MIFGTHRRLILGLLCVFFFIFHFQINKLYTSVSKPSNPNSMNFQVENGSTYLFTSNDSSIQNF